MKTSKSPVFRGGFQVVFMRWQVQKLVFGTPADMIDQKYQAKQVTQRQKYSKKAVEVEKKVTAFGKNIHLENFQPYGRKSADRTEHGNYVIFFVFLATVFGNLEAWKVRE